MVVVRTVCPRPSVKSCADFVARTVSFVKSAKSKKSRGLGCPGDRHGTGEVFEQVKANQAHHRVATMADSRFAPSRRRAGCCGHSYGLRLAGGCGLGSRLVGARCRFPADGRLLRRRGSLAGSCLRGTSRGPAAGRLRGGGLPRRGSCRGGLLCRGLFGRRDGGAVSGTGPPSGVTGCKRRCKSRPR